MKKQPFGLLTFIFSIFFCTNFSFSSNANLVTHSWQESHRGYSIELIPGTDENGIAAEYVAAGTVYDASFPGETGWHFMHLDVNGNILNSRIAWCPSADLVSYRVVDIAAEPSGGGISDRFWITIQARPLFPGQKDYIYIQGVDITGADLATNPQLNIFSVDNLMPNIYPTHSYFLNNTLYVCGYTANETNYPNVPNNNFSNKNGIFLKCDVNNVPFTYNFYVWNTGGGNTDFDMPLKIAPISNDDDVDLLVTGALNSDYPQTSGVLLMKFNQSGILLNFNGLLYPVPSYREDEVLGVYGIDIRGKVGNRQANPDDYIILVNSFSDYEPNDKSWGIMRTAPNFSAYPSTYNSYVHTNYQKGWAKQILEFDVPSSGNSHMHIVGEQTDPYCYTPTSPNLPESKTNVNAFISTFYFDGPSIWGIGSDPFLGWNSGIVATLGHLIYLSSQGTKASNLDYLNGVFPYNTSLEDASRLYTFASMHAPYDYSTGTPEYHAMILPIGEDPTTSTPDLLTKYLLLDPSFNEASCNQKISECPYAIYDYTFNTAAFTSEYFEGLMVTTNTPLENNTYTPGTIDCATGYYKTNSIKNINADVNAISIYPNPATSYVNIQLDKQLNNDKAGVFELADMSGKVVLQKSVVSNGKMLIKINLPDIAAGLYTGTVIIGGIKHVEKITIK